jgi:GNAT superfamily N-acetyltransferase
MSAIAAAPAGAGGPVSCWSPGDMVRYSPATGPAIAEAEGVIVNTTLQAGASLAGPGGVRSTGLIARRAEPGDRAGLEAMFQRCTPQTVYRRFHGHLRAFPGRFLDEAIAGVPKHYALVACCGSRVVAMASLVGLAGCCLGDPDRGNGGGFGTVAGFGASAHDGACAAELGILVEDEFQRRGLGRLLITRLAARAGELGLATIQAQVLMEQDWMLRLLGEFGRCESTFQRGVREVTLHLHS